MMWVTFVVLAVVVAWPFMMESRKVRIGRAEREGASGGFARLPQGVTYYRWFGPTRGPVIVAIHGLTTPSVAFAEMAEGLSALGYRVLTYDLFGRGWSDAPKGAQTEEFFHQQLNDMLLDQGVTDNLTLIGYSMGGSIAATFAAAQPDRMSRVILLASAGIQANETGFDRFCRTTPFLGDWLFLALGGRRLAGAFEAEHSNSQWPEVAAAQRAELARQGYLPSVLSSRRGMLSDQTEEAHRALGRAGVPVVGVWGDTDPVIPLSALGQLTQWNRATMQEVIEGADHALPYSHAQAVVDRLRDVLRERD